jgi:NAD(P)-dependent dehydrogenase (short-subunit alcohol dehydrogenase family)
MSRVAIVTGASRGIGRATAIRLARNFGAVAIVARTADTLAATADAKRPDGAEPLILARDPREPEAGEAHALELDAATERLAAEVGIVRYGRPDDIANAISFLFAPESQRVTGTAMRVDRGETKVL